MTVIGTDAMTRFTPQECAVLAAALEAVDALREAMGRALSQAEDETAQELRLKVYAGAGR